MPLPERSGNEAERTFAAIASTAFAEPDFRAAGGTVDALPAAGSELRYAVRAPDGARLIAIADRENNRLEAVETADGVSFRRLFASSTGSTILYAAQHYDRVWVNVVPPAAPTGPPVSVRPGPHLTSLSGVLPIVPCAVDGQAASCLLDTGTTPSAMTLDLAERLGREPRGHIEIAGFSTYLTGIVDGAVTTLGGATFGPLSFAVIPRARGAHFDVILGSDVLAAIGVVFEQSGSRIRITAREAPAAGAIPLVFEGGRPFLDAQLGSPPLGLTMLLDTGDTETLSIGYDTYRENSALFAAGGAGTAQGLAGSMDTLEGELDYAEIGGLAFERLPISAVRGQHVGHVGFGLVRHCSSFELELSEERIACSRVPPTGPASPHPPPPARDLER
jgi:hypothetical protein